MILSLSLLLTAALMVFFVTLRIAPAMNTDAGALDALLRTIAEQTHYAAAGDCGQLAAVAVTRLEAAGYRARLISIVTLETRNNVNDGHTLLEVFDPQSATWNVFDPSTDRLYPQTAWAFVQQRVGYIALTDHPTAPTYADELGVFADLTKFYTRVGQAVAIADEGNWWFGDADHKAQLEAYGYHYAPDFLMRFYA